MTAFLEENEAVGPPGPLKKMRERQKTCHRIAWWDLAATQPQGRGSSCKAREDISLETGSQDARLAFNVEDLHKPDKSAAGKLVENRSRPLKRA